MWPSGQSEVCSKQVYLDKHTALFYSLPVYSRHQSPLLTSDSPPGNLTLLSTLRTHTTDIHSHARISPVNCFFLCAACVETICLHLQRPSSLLLNDLYLLVLKVLNLKEKHWIYYQTSQHFRQKKKHIKSYIKYSSWSHLPSYLNSRRVGLHHKASKSFAGWTFGVWVSASQEEVPGITEDV